jgi:hypothetical protein
MSLHAQLSPEALARLHAQQRNSTITSIIISILVVLLIGIILLWILLPPIDNTTPDIVSYQAGVDESEQVQEREMNRAIERKPAAPTTSMAKVIASNTQSNIAIPIPDIEVTDPIPDFGTSDDWDVSEQSAGFGAIPQTMRKRCSKADRLDRLSKNGGNEQCEDAVVKSLRWLKKTQKSDGSWCNNPNRKVAMTAFAVLAYLGHCDTPNSEEFGDSVTRGIIYLVNVNMKNKGKMAGDFKDHWSYEHGIATYALAEAATFCRKLGINIPNLDQATKAAGNWIIEHQHKNGSWTYHYEKDTGHYDNSVGYWQIQALKACKHTGLWEEKEFKRTFKDALAFIKTAQAPSGSIGYRVPGDRTMSLTGGGVLCYQMLGKSHDSVVRKGADYITKNVKFDWNTEHADLYEHYYNAQAMINRGGHQWEAYNSIFRDQLLNNQNPDGTYKNVPKAKAVVPEFKGGGDVAVHYRTCLSTFMLEVYYRFLPATGAKHR